MSRVGKHAVAIPAGVTVDVKGDQVAVKGKGGTLSLKAPYEVTVAIDGGKVTVTPKSKSQRARTMWGTTRQNINNLIKGVSEGYKRELQIEGVGFKAAVQGKTLVLNIGFSHEVRYAMPEGITIATPKPTTIVVSGADKQRVGQTAAEIRGMKKPEPYKGKGIKFEGEWILRKAGKKK